MPLLRRITCIVAVLLPALTSMAQPFEGFGAVTKGGAGKPVVHVTNLESQGPGSLMEAMGSDRTIVFDVAGVINNFRWEKTDISNLTIDGTTAPSPGITIDNGVNGNGLSFEHGCHDIIVRNIRVRNAGNDCINVVGGWNMVFDHVSVSGSHDGGIDITEGSHDITVQYSILGPGAYDWSGAMLIAYHPTRNISIHHNLFSSRGETGVGERNPLVHSSNNTSTPYLMADIRNNVIWNWGNASTGGFGYGTGVDYGGTANIINNFYETTGSEVKNAVDFNHNDRNARGYVHGNVSGNRGVHPDSLGNLANPWPAASVTTQDACSAAIIVLARAGAKPLDSIDEALINNVSLGHCEEGDGARNGYLGIYPNPATDVVTIQYVGNATGMVQVSIFDVFGRRIRVEAMEKSKISVSKLINISTLQAGIYIAEIVTSGNAKVTKKFMKAN